MSKIVFLFCEDLCHIGMLEKIINDLNPTKGRDFRIIKTGGVRGQSAFVEGYLNRGGSSKSDVNIIFRDRDFDYPVPDTPNLHIEEKENKKSYALYRVTAENYLLSPYLFERYSQQNQSNRLDFDVNLIFEKAARRIAAYSAARHTLAFFRKNFSFRTTWTPNSGKLPTDLTDEYCFEKAWKLVTEKQAELCPIGDHAFKEKFDFFFSIFDNEFFANQKYLIWFNGKDMATSIKQCLPPRTDIIMDAYYRFALREFDYSLYPDLVQFRDILNAI